MPNFGRFGTSPERYGRSRGSLVEAIVTSLLAARGTAYDHGDSSFVYIEALAYARAIEAAWSATRRAANQFDPQRMDEFIPRWETILGLHPAASDTKVARRTQIARKWARFGKAPNPQNTYDFLKQICPNVFSSIANTSSADASTHIAAGATIPGGITVAAEPVDPVTNTKLITWSSSVGHVAFVMLKPAWMTEAAFYAEADSIYQFLDDWLPAWVTYRWVRDGSMVGKFILDDAHNLDNERFFAGPGSYAVAPGDFTRANGAGWAANAELTAAQCNQIDLDHAASVNRTGGSITGTVNVTTAAGTVTVEGGATPGALEWESGSTTTFQSGSTLTWAAASVPTIACASEWTGVVTLSSGTAHLIDGTPVGGLSAKLKTASGGRLQLGDGDFPTFSANRSRVLCVDLAAIEVVYGTGWLQQVDGLRGPGTANAGTVPLGVRWLHNGAKLASAAIYFTPASTHLALPATPLAMGITSRLVAAGAALPARVLVSAATSYAPVTLADYNNGRVKVFTHTPAAPPTLNTQLREYALQVVDENGAGALAGCIFHQVVLTFDTIPDMAFP